jgi:hypothetical protein
MAKKKATSKQPTQKQIRMWKLKAEKWDALDNALSKFYFDEEGNELEEGGGDLCDIGETAARAFGLM